ncbi:MAG: type II toxin-antitoxin system VapC family toxin [Xenococcaceae cyanobacterium MO_234.B1]|nr:type II toxin-antitoxin system VapC family toxin [Xenococcaceae cyanobacterium MO_234.B1]
MSYLLDTHTLLWWLSENPILSTQAKAIISTPQNLIFVSAVSAWEISIKKAIGKLEAPDDLEQAITHNNFTPLEITIKDGNLAGQLPNYHNDPFDRMLIAQAINNNLTIITKDSKIPQYQVKTILA